MEARLIALRNGAALVTCDSAAARARLGNCAATDRAEPEDALNDTAEKPGGSRETLRERERERFDKGVSGPFDDRVAVIRAGLGLKPGDDIPSGDENLEAALSKVTEASSATWPSTAHVDQWD